MEMYRIETPLDPEDCHRLVQEINAAGYLHYFE
jgi:hypothetical protein